MEHIQTAASFDWDTLGPLIFIAVAALAQLASKLKKGGQDSEDEPEVDAEERARRIREEIRRKIQERKQAEEIESQPLGHPPRRAAYDPTLPEDMQRRPSQVPPVRTLQPEPPKQVRPVAQPPRPVIQQKPPVTKATSIQDRLSEQMKLLEQSRKKQKEALEKAHRMEKAALAGKARARDTRKSVTVETEGNFRDQLVAGLRHPDSIRKAVLYREILGPPLGLR
ncbi:MAG: hypothetical protein AB3N63_09115 [Puniceicoccaceae bacterium]